MFMIYTIDAISKRYGLLPSATMAQATTYDLFVIDAAMAYEKYLADKAEGKKPTPKLDQQQMKAMMERVRDKKQHQ